MNSCLAVPVGHFGVCHVSEPSIEFLHSGSQNSLFVCFWFFGFLRDSVSLCSPGCIRIPSVDQGDLELRDSSTMPPKCWD